MQRDYTKELGQKVHRYGVVSVEKSYFKDDKEYFPFVLSTTGLDSDNEVVDITTAKLERFKSNSVGFFQHESYKLPILNWYNIRLEGSKLIADAYFHELPDEEGRNLSKTIKDYVKAGVLKAVSIGFMYSSMPEQMNIDGKSIWVIKDPDIYEASIVTIPANPEALIIDAKIKAMMGDKAGARLSKESKILVEGIIDNANKLLGDEDNTADSGKDLDPIKAMLSMADILETLKALRGDMASFDVKKDIEQIKATLEKMQSTPSQTVEDNKKDKSITLTEFLNGRK